MSWAMPTSPWENYPQAALHYYTYQLFNPDDANALLQYGESLYFLGEDYPAALDALDRAITLDSKLAEAYHYRGLVYLALDDANQAVKDINKALNLDTTSFEIRIDLGRALLAANNLNTAYEVLNAAEKYAKDDAQLAHCITGAPKCSMRQGTRQRPWPIGAPCWLCPPKPYLPHGAAKPAALYPPIRLPLRITPPPIQHAYRDVYHHSHSSRHPARPPAHPSQAKRRSPRARRSRPTPSNPRAPSPSATLKPTATQTPASPNAPTPTP